MADELLRVYLDPAEIGPDGYPWRWHKGTERMTDGGVLVHVPAIKDHVRECSGNRCLRCSHPYNGGGEWSPCDDECMTNDYHGFGDDGTWRHRYEYNEESGEGVEIIESRWRILTVHHLNGIKHDCRWWNLVALCQRCHLSVQGRVVMERPYHGEHSEWFRPYVAGFYAWHYRALELTREETVARMDELLELEHRQLLIEGE